MKIKLIATALSIFALGLICVQATPSNKHPDTEDPPSECEDGSGNSKQNSRSFDWFLDVGYSKFINSNNYRNYSRVGVSEGVVSGFLPRTLDSLLGSGGNTLNRKSLRLRLSSPIIDASLKDPSSMTIKANSNAKIIEVDGYIKQVLTDDAFTHVDKFTNGFKIRLWNRREITLGKKNNRTYPVESISELPFVEITYSNPSSATDDSELLITSVKRYSASPQIITNHYKEVLSTTTGRPIRLTIKTYEGLDTTGQLLKIEELAYSDRGAKTWDYSIERKIWTAKTTSAGIVNGIIVPAILTAPDQGDDSFLAQHDYEKYKDYSTTAAGGGKGTRRQISDITGYGTPTAKETRYTYIDSPENINTHGRLQSIVHPNGSWEFYEYTDSTSATTATEKKYTSWKNVTIANRENARLVTSIIEAQKVTRTTSIAGQVISKRVRTTTVDSNGVLTTTAVMAASETSETGSLSRYSSQLCHPQGAEHYLAGRLKWQELADGTASIYTYNYKSSDKTTTITTRTGAGNRDGVSQGTQRVQILDSNHTVLSEKVTDIASGEELSSWFGVLPLDNRNRFAKIKYADGTESSTTYACCGPLLKTDRSGAVTLYGRDALKRVYFVSRKASTNATAINTSTDYAGLTTITKRGGQLVSQTTRTLGGLTTTTKSPDANGDATPETTTRTMAYNSGGGTTTTVTYPNATSTSIITFADGSTKSITDQVGNTTTYDKGTHTEQGGGLWKKTTAANTTQWTATYTDHLGRSYKTQLSDGALSTQAYHPFNAAPGSRGKLATTTDPDENITPGTGTTTTFAYNAEGARTTTTESIAGSQTRTTLTDTTVVTDPDIGIAQKSTSTVNGILLSTSYRSANGYASKSVTLAGTSTSTRTIPTDGAWSVTSTTPDGQSAVQTYTQGRLDRSETFDKNGLSIAWTTTAYDSLNRTTSTTDSRTGITTINGYTDAGAVTSVTTNGGNDTTSYTYDVMGRRLTTTLPDTSVTHTSYTDRGQTLATWGSQTYARLYQYDSLGRMSELRTYQNLTHGTEPTVDTGIAIAAQGGNPAVPATYAATTWSYDADRGWLTEKNYDGETGNGPGNTADYTYTASGRLLTRTWERTADDGNGVQTPVTTTYNYDQGTLAAVTYSDTTPGVTYAYDNFGRPLTVTQGTNTHSYAYHATTLALDKETINYNGFIRVLDRAQDNLLRPAGFELKNGAAVETAASYGYDAVGRLATVTQGTDTFTYGYQPNTFGLVKTVTGPAHTVTNTYEANRNVLTNKENKAGANIRSNFAYTVNNLGQRTNLTTSGTAFATAPVWAWSYNGLGELVEANDTSTANNDRAFQYDGIGNRQKTANGLLVDLPASDNYTANALNQYTAIGAATPSYDLDGNATSYPLPAIAGANATMVWDAENRLIEVKNGAVTAATYQYDYLGRRISKTVGAVTTSYIYDGWNLIADYQIQNSQFTLHHSYTWGMDLSGSMQGAGGVGGLLSVNDTAASYYPIYDGNGNVSEYLDTSGVVQAHYEYDAFGNTIVSNGAKVADFSHRFSTKPLDAETGLYYYGYRYYDPTTGRWPSRDPIEEEGGINLYGFVYNNTNYWIDVLGGKPTKIGPGTGGTGGTNKHPIGSDEFWEWEKRHGNGRNKRKDPKPAPDKPPGGGGDVVEAPDCDSSIVGTVGFQSTKFIIRGRLKSNGVNLTTNTISTGSFTWKCNVCSCREILGVKDYYWKNKTSGKEKAGGPIGAIAAGDITEKRVVQVLNEKLEAAQDKCLN